MINKLTRYTLIVILYSICSIIFTYPLILQANNSLMGIEGDAYLFTWNIDTYWSEILQLHNPFYTNRIFYPLGVNLIFHTYEPLVSILGIFFISRLVLYLNLLVIISLVIAALSAFILAKYLTKNIIPAFLAGLIYGFSPVMIAYIESQHYYFNYAAGFLPLGAWCFFKFIDTQKTRYLAGILITFWLNLFTEYYTTILYILLISILTFSKFLGTMKYDRSPLSTLKQFIYSNIKTTILFFCIPLLFLILLLKSYFQIPTQTSNFSAVYHRTHNINLIGLITPSEYNPFLITTRKWFLETFHFQPAWDTPSYFIGYGIFILAIIGLILNLRDNRIKILSLFGLVSTLLAFGTSVKIGNYEILSLRFTLLYWLNIIPILRFILVPMRLIIGTQLIVAVLIAKLISKYQHKLKIYYGLILIIIILFILEYGTINVPISKIDLPQIFQLLKQDSDNRALLEIPSGISETKISFGKDYLYPALHTKQLYWQTIHKKPMVGGFVSRLPDQYLSYYQTEPILSDLWKLSERNGSWSNRNFTNEQILDFIKRFNLGHIILSPNPRQEYFSQIIEQVFRSFILEKRAIDGFVWYKLKL